MQKGFMYLVAIIDLYSRFVANWSVSNTIMDAEWCRHTLEQAIATHGNPEIVNTDLIYIAALWRTGQYLIQ